MHSHHELKGDYESLTNLPFFSTCVIILKHRIFIIVILPCLFLEVASAPMNCLAPNTAVTFLTAFM